MQRTGWVIVLLGAACFSAGCNSSQSGLGKKAKPDGLKPDAVVSNFLEAVRTGADEQAASMLTELAREMAEQHDMVIAPPGSTTASYSIGDVEVLPKGDVSHVSSTWSDEGEEHEIIWALRATDQGWRIAGMATKVFEDLDPVLLNFEDPEDMFEQQQAVEQEMFKRSQALQRRATVSDEGEDESETSEDTTEDRQATLPREEEDRAPTKGRTKTR